MNYLSSFRYQRYFRKLFIDITRNKSYKPVKLVSQTILPVCGEDRSLNPIIYVHGLTASKELWHDVPQIISDSTRRRSYAYDARCHGDSEWSDEFSYEITIEDLRYFMDTKSIEKAILVGHSLGGWTICMFALKWPERVEMLINEDMTVKDDVVKATDAHVLKYIQLWAEGVRSIPPHLNEAEGIIHAFDYLYDRFPTTKGLEAKEHLYKCKYPIKRIPGGYDVKHNMKAICTYLEQSLTQGPRQREGIYKGLGYFMMGDLSHYKIGMEEIRATEYPNVEMEIIEGVSHNIHLRWPDLFINKFLSFYNRNFNTSENKRK